MKKKATSYAPPATTKQTNDEAHPFRDCSQRFAIDELLREKGFRILERHKNDEPRWLFEGVMYFQGEAESELPQAELNHAIQRQERYYRTIHAQS